MKSTFDRSSRRITLIGSTLLIFLGLLLSCEKNETPAGPLNDGSGVRSQIVVISDIHLGADLAYAEINRNRQALADFLGRVKESPTVRELVIAGDMLDEWYVPATTDTYAGKDQADFVRRIATTNPEVIDAFNRIIKEGKIRVTYVPGNHDLTITAANVESILPGINQARDDVQGLGTYHPEDHPEIAIEHSHRYNFFCAPDPLSNRAAAPGSILPPGYFFTRIATLHHIQDCTTAGDTLPTVTPNPSGGESQSLAYGYWYIWKTLMGLIPVTNTFDDKMIVTNIDGFTQTYSMNDLIPYQETPGGFIGMNLYNGSMDNWDQRETINHVAVHFPTMQALNDAASAAGTDLQADMQYFTNPGSDVRIVVFGHSHEAKIIPGQNHAGLKSIYANTGTWIDQNPDRTTMNFVVITPQGADVSSQTDVKVYNFEGEVMTEEAADSLRL